MTTEQHRPEEAIGEVWHWFDRMRVVTATLLGSPKILEISTILGLTHQPRHGC